VHLSYTDGVVPTADVAAVASSMITLTASTSAALAAHQVGVKRALQVMATEIKRPR